MDRKKRKQILGDAMRKERVIRRVSQQQIADHLGLSKTIISAYERGKVSPAIDTLDACQSERERTQFGIVTEIRKGAIA